MKTAFWSIISAVIGGLMLFVAQTTWTNWQNSDLQHVDFETVTGDLMLSPDELTKLSGQLSKYDSSVTFYLINVSNKGTADVSNKAFSLSNSTIKSYGVLDSPNSNPKNITLEYDGKVLTARYRYLPKGVSNKIWIAALEAVPTLGPLKFSAEAPGVTTTNSPDQYASDPFPWLWFVAPAGALVLFLIGFGMGDANAADILKKRGLDYGEIKKMPADVPEKTG